MFNKYLLHEYKFLFFVFVLLAQVFWGGQGDMVKRITIADVLLIC